jgi:ferredoxin
MEHANFASFMSQLTILPSNQNYEVKIGTELIYLKTLYPEIDLKFGCQNGTCGVCIIQVLENLNHLSSLTKQEKTTLSAQQIHSCCRLACQCALLDSVVVLNDKKLFKV